MSRRTKGGTIPALVERFLETGQAEAQPNENPWLAFALSTFPNAAAAHQAWLAGDREAALALLRTLPGHVLGR